MLRGKSSSGKMRGQGGFLSKLAVKPRRSVRGYPNKPDMSRTRNTIKNTS